MSDSKYFQQSQHSEYSQDESDQYLEEQEGGEEDDYEEGDEEEEEEEDDDDDEQHTQQAESEQTAGKEGLAQRQLSNISILLSEASRYLQKGIKRMLLIKTFHKIRIYCNRLDSSCVKVPESHELALRIIYSLFAEKMAGYYRQFKANTRNTAPKTSRNAHSQHNKIDSEFPKSQQSLICLLRAPASSSEVNTHPAQLCRKTSQNSMDNQVAVHNISSMRPSLQSNVNNNHSTISENRGKRLIFSLLPFLKSYQLASLRIAFTKMHMFSAHSKINSITVPIDSYKNTLTSGQMERVSSEHSRDTLVNTLNDSKFEELFKRRSVLENKNSFAAESMSPPSIFSKELTNNIRKPSTPGFPPTQLPIQHMVLTVDNLSYLRQRHLGSDDMLPLSKKQSIELPLGWMSHNGDEPMFSAGAFTKKEYMATPTFNRIPEKTQTLTSSALQLSQPLQTVNRSTSSQSLTTFANYEPFKPRRTSPDNGSSSAIGCSNRLMSSNNLYSPLPLASFQQKPVPPAFVASSDYFATAIPRDGFSKLNSNHNNSLNNKNFNMNNIGISSGNPALSVGIVKAAAGRANIREKDSSNKNNQYYSSSSSHHNHSNIDNRHITNSNNNNKNPHSNMELAKDSFRTSNAQPRESLASVRNSTLIVNSPTRGISPFGMIEESMKIRQKSASSLQKDNSSYNLGVHDRSSQLITEVKSSRDEQPQAVGQSVPWYEAFRKQEGSNNKTNSGSQFHNNVPVHPTQDNQNADAKQSHKRVSTELNAEDRNLKKVIPSISSATNIRSQRESLRSRLNAIAQQGYKKSISTTSATSGHNAAPKGSILKPFEPIFEKGATSTKNKKELDGSGDNMENPKDSTKNTIINQLKAEGLQFSSAYQAVDSPGNSPNEPAYKIKFTTFQSSKPGSQLPRQSLQSLNYSKSVNSNLMASPSYQDKTGKKVQQFASPSNIMRNPESPVDFKKEEATRQTKDRRSTAIICTQSTGHYRNSNNNNKTKRNQNQQQRIDEREATSKVVGYTGINDFYIPKTLPSVKSEGSLHNKSLNQSQTIQQINAKLTKSPFMNQEHWKSPEMLSQKTEPNQELQLQKRFTFEPSKFERILDEGLLKNDKHHDPLPNIVNTSKQFQSKQFSSPFSLSYEIKKLEKVLSGQPETHDIQNPKPSVMIPRGPENKNSNLNTIPLPTPENRPLSAKPQETSVPGLANPIPSTPSLFGNDYFKEIKRELITQDRINAVPAHANIHLAVPKFDTDGFLKQRTLSNKDEERSHSPVNLAFPQQQQQQTAPAQRIALPIKRSVSPTGSFPMHTGQVVGQPIPGPLLQQGQVYAPPATTMVRAASAHALLSPFSDPRTANHTNYVPITHLKFPPPILHEQKVHQNKQTILFPGSRSPSNHISQNAPSQAPSLPIKFDSMSRPGSNHITAHISQSIRPLSPATTLNKQFFPMNTPSSPQNNFSVQSPFAAQTYLQQQNQPKNYDLINNRVNAAINYSRPSVIHNQYGQPAPYLSPLDTRAINNPTNLNLHNPVSTTQLTRPTSSIPKGGLRQVYSKPI